MKKVITFMLACAMAATMAACGAKVDTDISDNADTSMFVQIEKGDDWKVFYHKDTKVMYVMSSGSRSWGIFTVMLNPDGSPMVYKEKDIPHVRP